MISTLLLCVLTPQSPEITPWHQEALQRRAAFTRSHRGAFAAPRDGDAADSQAYPAAWHAGDRVCFAWHKDNRILFKQFDARGNPASGTAILGSGRWPRVTAGGRQTAVAWNDNGAFLLRLHDGESWRDPVRLDGLDAAIAFSADGQLFAATTTGLWRISEGKAERIREGAFTEPALALGADGKPRVAWRRDGKILCDDDEIGAGERPSIAISGDGTMHVAWTATGALMSCEHKTAWSKPKRVAASKPEWATVALSDKGARVTYVGAAEHGPPAVWMILPDDPKPLLLPSIAGNVTEAWLLVRFGLTKARGSYRPHDVEITLNGFRVAQLEETVPDGRYFFPVAPWNVFTTSWRPVHNRIMVRSRHVNPGHYLVATDYRLVVNTSWGEHFAFVGNDSEALKSSEGRGANHSHPDLAILANAVKLPIERPEPGRLELPITVINLGPGASVRCKLALTADGKPLSRSDVPVLKSGERRVVTVPLEWNGTCDEVIVALEGNKDFEPENDSFRLRLWGAPYSSRPSTRRPERESPKATPGTFLTLKLPAGMQEPDFLATVDGQEALNVAGYATKHAERYAVPPGSLSLEFRQRVLSPFTVEVKDGEVTTLDLTSVGGLLKIVPYEGTPQPELEVYQGGKLVQTVAGYAVPPADAYILAPGEYEIRFKQRILTDVSVKIDAGRETVLDLARDLAEVVFKSDGNVYLGGLDVFSKDGTIIRTVAPYAVHPRESYGFGAGSYRIEFKKRYAMPIPLEISRGGPLAVDLDSIYGTLALEAPADHLDLDVSVGKQQVVTVAAYAFPHAAKMGLLPGTYRIAFRKAVVVPLTVEMKAGQTTTLALSKSCAEVRLVAGGKPYVESFDLEDAQGTRLQTIAPYAIPPSESWWILPGHYRLAFKKQYATPLVLDVAEPKPMPIDLDERYGYLALELPPKMRGYELWKEDGSAVCAIAPHSMPHEERMGLAPGAYGLDGTHIPARLTFKIEAGKTVTPAFGKVEIELPTDVRVFDAKGTEVNSILVREVGKPGTVYLPEGDWELRFGKGYQSQRITVAAGKSQKVEPKRE